MAKDSGYMRLSAILATHNPDAERLRRTLQSLRNQTLPEPLWEAILIDNASHLPLAAAIDRRDWPATWRLVHEPRLGLSAARRRGLLESVGEVIVLVDDDNELAPDYFELALAALSGREKLGALGGSSEPEFEVSPPLWVGEFSGLLACRDLGDEVLIDGWKGGSAVQSRPYFSWAPIGAGMVLRREAARHWLECAEGVELSDRRGEELTSGGDNDIVLSVLGGGWEVGYLPQLRLTHLIPASRTTLEYLGRIHRAIAASWIEVLAKHGACPWGPIPPWTLPLRRLKAWFSCRAWSSPGAYVRWQGACGHFDGRAKLPR